jgi:hypothetical protein
LELDPYLQNCTYIAATRALTGFAARARTGFYGRGRTITAPAVSSALTAIGQTIAMATGANPTKLQGSDKLIPKLAQSRGPNNAQKATSRSRYPGTHSDARI